MKKLLLLIALFLVAKTYGCKFSEEKVAPENVRAQLNLNSKLCHGKNSPWFERMKSYRDFKSMGECLEYGRRRAYE